MVLKQPCVVGKPLEPLDEAPAPSPKKGAKNGSASKAGKGGAGPSGAAADDAASTIQPACLLSKFEAAEEEDAQVSEGRDLRVVDVLRLLHACMHQVWWSSGLELP